MEVLRPADAAAFLELAGPLLERDEARHNLILGIAGTLLHQPGFHSAFRFWVAVDGGRPVAAALQTEPYNLVVADPEGDAALGALLTAVHDDEASIPGIVANVPHAEAAARRWAALTSTTPETVLEEGVYALRNVRDVRRPSGASRKSTHEDRDLLLTWYREFCLEALPDPERELGSLERSIDVRLSGAHGGAWMWEIEGSPVAFAGYSGPTPSGIRVGPVYTPPEHRRRGYGTALVADMSRALLDAGHRACFLYTNLANPTANGIYVDIGYERVCDAAEIRFRAP